MSVHVTSWVWKDSKAQGTDKLVLLKIADNANDDGTDAWPALQTIADQCGINRRTAKRNIETLIELGELLCETNAGGPIDRRADRRTNRYTVIMNGGAICHPVEERGGVQVATGGQIEHLRGGDTPPKPSLEPSINHPGLFLSLEAAFEVGWSKYPRRTDKGDALKKFKETVVTHGVDPEKLAATMGRYAKWCQREETPKNFIKHGKTFFGPKLSWQEFMEEPKTEVQSDGYYEQDGLFYDPDGEEISEDGWYIARDRISLRATNAATDAQ